MIHRDQHTQLSITTPILDASAFMTLAEDLSPTIAREYLTAFTSLLETRITDITNALAHHAQDTEDAKNLKDADVVMDAVLNLRAGASMAGARRVYLLMTTALSDIRADRVRPEILIRELKNEARAFKTAVARLQHPSAHAA